jgi:nitrogen regulatory protein PII
LDSGVSFSFWSIAGYDEHYRGQVKSVNLLEKIRIEIAVNDEFVEAEA